MYNKKAVLSQRWMRKFFPEP